MSLDRNVRIQRLNDIFRCAACGSKIVSGEIVATDGVLSLGENFLARAILAVKSHNNFTPGNDPYGKHDFGAFTIDSKRLFWKIDYYDRKFEFGSPDPADPEITRRVLTILLASEY